MHKSLFTLFIILSAFTACDSTSTPCGDTIIDPGEQCDGDNLAYASCQSLGFPGGTLRCASDCTLDQSACEGVPENCGDGNINPGEQCDGSNFGVMTCALLGYESGDLACTPGCTYDVSACQGVLDTCGDSIVQMGENCDGSTGGATCESYGFVGGTLRCEDCKIATDACDSPPEGCGNGDIDSGEECDGDNLAGSSCSLLGLPDGTLACTAMCTLDTTGCRRHRQIVAAKQFSCILSREGRAWCWGDGAEGQTGNATFGANTIPTRVNMPTDVTFSEMSGTYRHICAMGENHNAYCWGSNAYQEASVGGVPEISVPTPPATFTGNLVETVAAGAEYSCALSMVGQVSCWGSNLSGKLGTGTTDDESAPRLISLNTFSRLGIGYNHTCGLDTSGAWCWGYGNLGQLGNGRYDSVLFPEAVAVPAGVVFTDIRPGVTSTCALDFTGRVWCWGDNTEGQLGCSETIPSSSAPILVDLPEGMVVVKLSVGRRHACVLNDEGSAWCWGLNESGQVGSGLAGNAFTPVPVTANSTRFVDLSCGFDHTCALDTLGDGYCWGSNEMGQLGNGTVMNAPTPVSITAPL